MIGNGLFADRHIVIGSRDLRGVVNDDAAVKLNVSGGLLPDQIVVYKGAAVLVRIFRHGAEGKLHEVLSPANLVYTLPIGTPECTDVTLDATHTFDCHCDDITDLSRQIVDQHRKVVWFVEFLREYVAGFENAVLEMMAPMNGVRDSRRVVGEYIFTGEDMASARKFEDGILQHTEMFDAHVATPGLHGATRHIHLDHEVSPAHCRPSQDDDDFMHHPFVAMGGYEVRTSPREYCEFPYRSLIAKGIDNLLVAGRCASADYHASGSIRVIAPSMGMGMAAGVGAAMTIDKKLDACRDLDGKLVRERLIELGVKLNELPGGLWETRRNMPGRIVVSHMDACCIVNDEGADATNTFTFKAGKDANKKPAAKAASKAPAKAAKPAAKAAAKAPAKAAKPAAKPAKKTK